MRFSVIKKPLALLLIVAIVGAIAIMAANSVSGQQGEQGLAPAESGGYAVPGVPGITIGAGTNTVALSVSIASQQDNRIYFQVNSFAVMDPQTQTFNVYELSTAMPGIMDTSTNMVQIDIAKLQSSVQSTSQASMDDLYSVLRPSVNSLMVIAGISQQGQQGAKATFQVQSLKVIMPDGQENAFDLSQPMAIVVDGAARRVFTVGFEQMYSLVNTYIVNIQNNYYTQINYNIVPAPVVVVSPPVVYPVLTPIAFPAAWPVFFPVPVPVPIPIVTVKPHPPSVTPTMKPTASPTGKPTVSPTGMPTVSPTTKPTVGATVTPTGKPTVTVKPTGKPTISAKPTGKGPIATFKPSLIATKVASPKPTGKGPIATFKPSLIATKVASPKPTAKGPIATFKPSLIATKVAKPTKLVSTIKPVVGTPTKTTSGGKLPIATFKAPVARPTMTGIGGGGVPTAFKPTTTKAPVTGGGKVKPGQTEDVLATILPYRRPSPSPNATATIAPTRII